MLVPDENPDRMPLMPMSFRRILLPSLACFMVLSCGCAREQPAPGHENLAAYSLRAYDSIGVETGNEMLMFGNISDACILEDGRTAVVDRIFKTVRVFSESGDFLAEISGTGTGPLEFLAPTFVSPWGSGLMICSFMDMKELYYDSNCVCVGEVRFEDPTIRPGCPVRVQAVDDTLFVGDTFFITVQKNGDYEGGTEVSLWDGDARVRTFWSRTAETFNQLTFQIDARIHSYYDPGSGRLYWADAVPDRYEVHCFDLAADSEWVFVDRDWSPVPKPDSIVQEERELYTRSWNEGTGHDPEFDFPVNPFYNAVEGIGVDSLGRVWIRTGLCNASMFDVYDGDGVLLFACSLDVSDWQDLDGWDVTVCRQGFLAFTRNPETYPKVYMLELVGE